MAISRKRLLQNAGWATAGAAFGALGRGLLGPAPADRVAPSAPLPLPLPRPAPGRPVAPWPRGEESFSQCGEDLVVYTALRYLRVPKIDYLDIGANHPIQINNTYFFYRKGFRGVLVEPNAELCEELRGERPGDTTLAVGIGAGEAREADYYVMSSRDLNTFSKDEAEHQIRASNGSISIVGVIKVPLRDINDVMDEHFRGAPAFLSIDTEGFDLTILRSIDYARFRPKVICAETLVSSSTAMRAEIPEFMATRGYVVRGGSIANTVFVDSRLL